MTSVQIRQAESDDLEAIVALDEGTFGAMAFPRFFIRQACDAFGELLLIGEDDGAVVAYGLGVAQAEREDGWILAMAVAPEHRGQGIGARLLVELFAVFERIGVGRVLLTVEPGNAPARRLYDEHGFVEVDEEDEYFGPGEPRVVMARNI